MTKINDAFRALAENSEMSRWYIDRAKMRGQKSTTRDPSDWRKPLERFLSSSMDDERSKSASEFANYTLTLDSFPEAAFFRKVVLRREARGDIAYLGQRDHTTHTVNNWLLGWLIYDQSSRFRDAFAAALEPRLATWRWAWKLMPRETHQRHAFGVLWLVASLLHDIGYMFEGSLEPLDWQTRHQMTQLAATAFHDYFEHQLFRDWGVRSFGTQDWLREKVAWPSIETTGSLASLAAGLCRMGALEGLRTALIQEHAPLKSVGGEFHRGGKLGKKDSLDHFDAFDLWEAHYRHFGMSEMAGRVRKVREVFDQDLYEGTSKGLRMIDHGVASGLLSLQLTARYYVARDRVGHTRPSTFEETEWREFYVDGYFAPAGYWWSGLLWGTFAAAIHNIQEDCRSHKIEALDLDDDPLAFLGVLVDTLQEWDRPRVRPDVDVAKDTALQSSDVGFEPSEHGCPPRLALEPRRADKIGCSLDKALKNWRKVVDLPAPSTRP